MAGDTGIACGFGSRNLTAHLTRGLSAATLLVSAALTRVAHPYLAICALMLALVLMRGCPVCWCVGLCDTLSRRRA